MKTSIECNWIDNMAFETSIDEYRITIDAGPEVGGQGRGPKPKPMLLTALAGCSGMDVISILAKMKVVPDAFKMTVTGDMTEEHPKYYKSIHIIYHFKGKDLPLDKLEKAIQLSQEKYCGVSAQLKASAALTHEIQVDG